MVALWNMHVRRAATAGANALDCPVWLVAHSGADLEYLPIDTHIVRVANGVPSLYTDSTVVIPEC